MVARVRLASTTWSSASCVNNPSGEVSNNVSKRWRRPLDKARVRCNVAFCFFSACSSSRRLNRVLVDGRVRGVASPLKMRRESESLVVKTGLMAEFLCESLFFQKRKLIIAGFDDGRKIELLKSRLLCCRIVRCIFRISYKRLGAKNRGF